MSASTEQSPDRPEPIRVVSELLGTVVTLEVAVGVRVGAGQVVALIESMKLHHEVVAPADGRVVAIVVAVGDTVRPGDLLLDDRASVPRRRGSTTSPPATCRRDPFRPDSIARIWPRCSNVTGSASTRRGRPPLPAAASGRTAPPARTSPTSSTRVR